MTVRYRAKRVVTRIVRAWGDSRLRLGLVRARCAVASRLIPWRFWYGKYPHTFLERRPPSELGGPSELPRKIWVFWTGSNPMSDVRRAGFDAMVASNSDIPIVLVTPDNLHEFIVEGAPLHPAYENLSLVHRSDYLRAYFLHHYGGGYSDIKPLLDSWVPHFEALEVSDAWVHGAALRTPYEVGSGGERIGWHLQRYYRNLVSSGTVIMRSHTPLTAEWLREVERKLDYAAPALAECPGDVLGEEPAYALSWMELLGDVLQPLTLKYSEHVLIDRKDWWDTTKAHR